LATLDWVVVAALALSVLLGLWRGLVYEVLSVLNWIAAFLAAQWLAPYVGDWLGRQGFVQHEPLRYAAGFAAVFIATLIVGSLLAWLLKKLVEAIGLRPVDRALGGLFGLLRGAVAVLALAVVVHLTGLRDGGWWTESVTAGVATAALRGLKPVVPEQFSAFLPT
jgi:membrane protein required for colicin V production